MSSASEERGDQIDAGSPKARAREARPDSEPSAWRLTFEYDDGGVRLVAQQRVAMLAPPDDSALTLNARAGYWIEVRDATGHGLYRQILVNPMPSHREVHSPEPDRHPRRVPVIDGSGGVFQAVVPDLPGGVDVVLHGLAAPGPAATLAERSNRTAVPLLTEPLAETRPYGEA